MSFFDFMGMMITKDLMEKEEREKERVNPLFAEDDNDYCDYDDDDNDDMWD